MSRLIPVVAISITACIGSAAVSTVRAADLEAPTAEEKRFQRLALARRTAAAIDISNIVVKRLGDVTFTPLEKAALTPGQPFKLAGEFSIKDKTLKPPQSMTFMVKLKKETAKYGYVIHQSGSVQTELAQEVHSFAGETKAPTLPGTYELEFRHNGNSIEHFVLTVK